MFIGKIYYFRVKLYNKVDGSAFDFYYYKSSNFYDLKH